MHIYCVFVSLMFLFIQQSEALRCRTGNQETSEEIRKVIQKCKRQESDSRDTGSSSTAENDSDEDVSADSSIFDEEFFSATKKNQNSSNNNGNNTNYRNTRNSGNGNSNFRTKKRNFQQEQMRPYYMNPMNYSGSMVDRMRNDNNNNNNMYQNLQAMQYNNHNNNNNNNHRRNDNENSNEKSCVVQCFFNELNLVDSRGFPERLSVTKILLQGVYDPAVRDFVEESILECFHFLQSEEIHEKCTFSKHLLRCFADKGRERCEDWDN